MKVGQALWLLKGGPKTFYQDIVREDGSNYFLVYKNKRYYFKVQDALLRASKNWSHPAIPEIDSEIYYYADGYSLIRERGDLGRIIWQPLGKESVKVMSNKFIVDSTLGLMEDTGMREQWKATTKNSYQFADIVISPTSMTFDNAPLKMSFMQRLKFLSAYKAIVEYHTVKRFRDSIAKVQAHAV